MKRLSAIVSSPIFIVALADSSSRASHFTPCWGNFERPRFYLSNGRALVRGGFERRRKIELWNIAKWPAENSACAGGLCPPTPESRRQRPGKEGDTKSFLRHSGCSYFQRRIQESRRK